MGRAERDKGRKGEAEVAELYRARGLEVRGLEASGDHLVICGPHSGVVLHSEVKRQEVARPWVWYEQAIADAPASGLAVVHFRRNRSPWLALLGAGELADTLASLEASRAANAHLRERVLELEHRLDSIGEPVG
jgi:hypothetical protein